MTMTEQPDLFSAMPRVVEPTEYDGAHAGLTLDERVDLFVECNPDFYARLVNMARALVARGRKRVGMKMILEVCRWDYYMSTDDPTSQFKVNNSYGSRLARRIMDEHPELEGVFETRELRS